MYLFGIIISPKKTAKKQLKKTTKKAKLFINDKIFQ